MYTLELKDDGNGELLIEFPDELMNQMGWDIGTVLIWEEMEDGSWSVSKGESNGEEAEETEFPVSPV